MADVLERLKAALADRYRIERELGSGGMATVYLAHDLKHERQVAVKVLRPELAAVLGAERFVQEIKTTANLQHPNILPLFDSGEAGGFLYYVMPFIDGETLRDKLNRETQLGIEEAVKVATEVADALDYAHRHDVIHRDIKPENILLHDGRPMVADFGIALAVSAAAGNRMTETGLSLGTPHYMSPEQATAEKDLSNRSDVYSLGAVLYEMLTGDPPHTGSSAQQIIMKIVTEEAQPVTELRKLVPPNVAAATAKALEKLPADRFGSAAEMAAAIRNPGFRSADVGGRGTGASPRSSPLTVPLLISVAVVSTALAAWGWLRPVEEAARAVRFTIPVPSGHLMHNGEGTRLALSPDGSSVAWVANDGSLYVRRLDEFESLRLEGTEPAENPFFSPDGRWVGFARDGGLRKVAVDGGPVIEIPGVVGTAFDAGAHWHSSGSIVYTPHAGADGIWSVPEAGGTPRQIVTRQPDEAHTIWPQLLGDGELLLYTAPVSSGSVRDLKTILYDLRTGDRFVVAEGGTYARYVSAGHIVYTDGAGTVFARPVDLRARRATGPAFPVQAGVRVSYWGAGAASLQISTSGTAAFVRGSTAALHRIGWIDRQGRVTGYLGEPLTAGDLRLSPDGTRLVTWISTPDNADLWIIDASSGERTKLTDAEPWEWRGVWSPDGTRIAHQGSVGGRQALFVRDAAPGRPSTPILETPTELWTYSWSSDGRWVVFGESSGEGQRNVYAADMENPGQQMTIAATDADEEDARFAPGGGMVAYVSDDEVMVASFPGLDWQRRISNGGGRSPRWSPRGDELLYWQGSALISHAWRSEAPRDFGPPRVLFTRPEQPMNVWQYWDVGRDGQRFLVLLTNPDASAPEIRVDTDWFGRLKQAAADQR
jgi:serine/threonine-protein kinase